MIVSVYKKEHLRGEHCYTTLTVNLSNVGTFFKTVTNAAPEFWHAGSRGCCVS